MKRTTLASVVAVAAAAAAAAILVPREPLSWRGSRDDWTCHRFVAHALGAWRGRVYTNSREGFERAYRRGFRVFEVDLETTSDGVLVATHGWPRGRLSLAAFRRASADRGFSPLTFADLLDLMADRPGVYVVLDTKSDPLPIWTEVERIAARYPAAVHDRLIPQLYRTDAREVEATREFPRVLLTVYRADASRRAVLRFLDRTGIGVVTLPVQGWDVRLVRELERRRVSVYVHTIDDPDSARTWLARGVRGIYSDSIGPAASSAACVSSKPGDSASVF